MTIGLVFVNYFSADLIADHVERYRDADVLSVVVDNSGDYQGPGVVVGDGANIGFGSACNLGVDALDSSIATAILHNPDVYPTHAVVEEAARRVAQTGVGLVAPALSTPEGLVANGYSYPRRSAELLAARTMRTGWSSGGHDDDSPSVTGRAVVRRAVRSVERSARFGSAALLAVDVERFRAIGGFDDRFILYGEDLDLWHRMKTSGARTLFANDLSAFHERGGGSPASRQTRELLRFAGIQLFAQLHHGSRWKQFRAIHRRAVAAVEPDNKIGEVLRTEWDLGHDPVATAGALRARFLDGVMADPSSNNGHTPLHSNRETDTRA